MSNSQGRNLGHSVGFGITSNISSTQGIGLQRERLRYLTASLTNTNDTFWTNVKQSTNEHNTSITEYSQTPPTQNIQLGDLILGSS